MFLPLANEYVFFVAVYSDRCCCCCFRFFNNFSNLEWSLTLAASDDQAINRSCLCFNVKFHFFSPVNQSSRGRLEGAKGQGVC